MTQQSEHELETMVEVARIVAANEPKTFSAIAVALAKTVLELWEMKHGDV